MDHSTIVTQMPLRVLWCSCEADTAKVTCYGLTNCLICMDETGRVFLPLPLTPCSTELLCLMQWLGQTPTALRVNFMR